MKKLRCFALPAMALVMGLVFIGCSMEPDESTPTDAETPVIITHPASASYNPGNTVDSLSVTATKSDGGILSYEWFKNTANSDSGGTKVGDGSTYTPIIPQSITTPVNDYYYVVVTNTNKDVDGEKKVSITSKVANILTTTDTLYHAESPSITAPSQDQTVSQNTPVTLTVTVSGEGYRKLTYQWYESTTRTEAGLIPISGATSSSYTPPTNTAGSLYYAVQVTNTDTEKNGTKVKSARSPIVEVNVTATATQPPQEDIGAYNAAETEALLPSGWRTMTADQWNAWMKSNDADITWWQQADAIYFIRTHIDQMTNQGAKAEWQGRIAETTPTAAQESLAAGLLGSGWKTKTYSEWESWYSSNQNNPAWENKETEDAMQLFSFYNFAEFSAGGRQFIVENMNIEEGGNDKPADNEPPGDETGAYNAAETEKILPSAWKTMSVDEWDSWMKSTGNGSITTWQQADLLYFIRTNISQMTGSGAKDKWQEQITKSAPTGTQETLAIQIFGNDWKTKSYGDWKNLYNDDQNNSAEGDKETEEALNIFIFYHFAEFSAGGRKFIVEEMGDGEQKTEPSNPDDAHSGRFVTITGSIPSQYIGKAFSIEVRPSPQAQAIAHGSSNKISSSIAGLEIELYVYEGKPDLDNTTEYTLDLYAYEPGTQNGSQNLGSYQTQLNGGYTYNYTYIALTQFTGSEPGGVQGKNITLNNFRNNATMLIYLSSSKDTKAAFRAGIVAGDEETIAFGNKVFYDIRTASSSGLTSTIWTGTDSFYVFIDGSGGGKYYYVSKNPISFASNDTVINFDDSEWENLTENWAPNF